MEKIDIFFVITEICCSFVDFFFDHLYRDKLSRTTSVSVCEYGDCETTINYQCYFYYI